MFKAKLIENDSYYKFRSKSLFLVLLPAIAIGVLVNLYEMPIWLTITMLTLYVSTVFLQWNNKKRMASVMGNYWIELEESEIRIISKRDNNTEIIDLNLVDELTIQDVYMIPQEPLKDIGQEIQGNVNRNFIDIRQNGKRRKFEFALESNYMLVQLNKVIEQWKSDGRHVVLASHN